MLLRSFMIQGSWNYRTLIGHGFAFVLLPALREIYRDRPDELRAAIARHAEVFNSHPYMAGIAAGAVARLESEAEDPELIRRFKTALRGSLGSFGDRLVWAGWRPACALLALVLAFAGLPWWLCIGGFLLLYNVGHVAVRAWGFDLGFDAGRAVGQRLRASPLIDIQRALGGTGAFLLGLLLPVAIGGGFMTGAPPLAVVLTACVAAVAGLRWKGRLRTPLFLALTAVALFGIGAGAVG